MALSIDQIVDKVEALKSRAVRRDARASDVLLVRQGRITEVYPDYFPQGVDTNVVANFVDIVARDLSEVMAPLPSINCSASNSAKPKARTFADNRTRIASNYFIHSDLTAHMYTFADRYVTYGFAAFIVELDPEDKLPRIRVEDSYKAYPEFDRYGRCTAFAKEYFVTLGELIAQYPEYELELRGGLAGNDTLSAMMKMIRYYDKDQSIIYIPERYNLVVSAAKNPIGKLMVVVAKRPSVDDEMRGQFDDVLGIQLLRNRFALLAIEAAEKAIQAPIVLPQDVVELEFGPDAVIRTNDPSHVRRVEMNIPQAALVESASLSQEMQTGARYPQSRTGNVNASVITGQGVQALMGAFDTQVKSFQAIAATALREVIKICFMVDEMVFDVEKTIRGVDAGSPYAITYKPSKDINGDYSAEVRYGILAGLNPAQGLIFILQAMQADLISNDMGMRELPFNVNVTVEQEKIEVEKMRKSLLVSLEQSALAIPQMMMQGQDPSAIVAKIAAVISGRQNGKQLEDIVSEIFAPVEQETPAEQTQGGAVEEQGEQVAPAPSQDPAMQQALPQPPMDAQTIMASLTQSGKANGRVTTSATNRK